jgi:para-aminobenzoate synthetase component 1
VALQARLLDLRPDPLELARRLWDRPGVALLWSGFGRGRALLACDPSDEVRTLDPEPALELDPEAGPLASAPRWVGILPYESRRSIERPQLTRTPDLRPPPHVSAPRWLRYGAVAVVSDRVLVVGDEPASVRHLCSLLRRSARPAHATLALGEPPEAAEAHARRIRTALKLIRAGDLYQVNLARRFGLVATGSAVELLAKMSDRGWTPYSIALSLGDLSVVSTSPELFLALGPGRQLLTRPHQGNATPRHRRRQRRSFGA